MSRNSISDRIFTVSDAQGDVERDLRFDELPVGQQLQKSFCRAFKAQFGHLESTTLKTNFSAVRIFCKYLLQTHATDCLDKLSPTELDSFVLWLGKSCRKDSTSQSILNIVRSLLVYAARNNTGGVPSSIDLNVVGFRREEPSQANVVSSETRARILEACRQEIEAGEGMLRKGQEAIAEAQRGNPSDLGEILLSVLDIGHGRYVKKEELRKVAPNTLKKMQIFGFREAYAHLYITHGQLFPFYLAIVAETGGNPDAIHQVKRDCFISHPTKPDFVLFVWQKKRAHAEQFAGYSLKREWSAAGLIKKLKDLNESLITQAKRKDQDSLFIGMSSSAGAGRSCTQLLHIFLGDFIKRHGLQKFTFRELRTTVAEEGYLKKGDIEDARERLSHASSSMTQRYLSSSLINRYHESKIVKFSGMLVANARALNQKSDSAPVSEGQRAQTLFGFSCKDPYSGLAPGSQKGRSCDKFYGCSTCPGSIVVLDDPKLVAKLICTAAHLRGEQKRAVAEGWGIRFDNLYAPTLKILEEEILPLLTTEMIALAQGLIVPTLPRLE